MRGVSNQLIWNTVRLYSSLLMTSGASIISEWMYRSIGALFTARISKYSLGPFQSRKGPTWLLIYLMSHNFSVYHWATFTPLNSSLYLSKVQNPSFFTTRFLLKTWDFSNSSCHINWKLKKCVIAWGLKLSQMGMSPIFRSYYTSHSLSSTKEPCLTCFNSHRTDQILRLYMS